MEKSYRVTAYVRFSNTMNAFLVRLGLQMGSTSLLSVRGRKSGKLIETPLSLFVQDHQRYLIAPYGIVNWVRNLRAAGGEATLTRGRQTESIRAVELEPAAAARVFREAVRMGPDGIPPLFVSMYRHFVLSKYLSIAVDAPLEDFEREAVNHPVFLVTTAYNSPLEEGSHARQAMQANERSL
ncbi:nitroreductase/quinone reductase family protein [Ktedonobacter robiniae]|uniref:Nitroreductase n=1 Tax=Ktedonobacter robiniae TaxID=2778365 RepID=A0ABQ3V8L6_9CHLR|nr:nitroreductase/quinone reductase family protein [Ktedonobacter robiniae]GHO60965.1 nitroreductase [Ktedonobacter robiniae]